MTSNHESGAEPGDILASATRAHIELVEALRSVWEHCERFYDDDLSLGRGGNLPELLRGALTELGREVGGTDGLTRHRPGSWEAQHVTGLGAFADLDPSA